MVTKTNLLKAKLIEYGITHEQIAEMIGISHASFSYKLNNKRVFTSVEIKKIADVLKLTPDEVMKIFFANDVD